MSEFWDAKWVGFLMNLSLFLVDFGGVIMDWNGFVIDFGEWMRLKKVGNCKNLFGWINLNFDDFIEFLTRLMNDYYE